MCGGVTKEDCCMRVRMLCILGVVLVGLGLQAGCGAGLGRSNVDRQYAWNRAIDTDLKAINDDVDLWLMMDRPMRLSKWRTN